jgi:carbonic anhydrase
MLPRPLRITGRFLACFLALHGFAALAEPSWRAIESPPGRSIEVDAKSIEREAQGTLVATSRLVLAREISDARTSAPYRFIQTTSRYDCDKRTSVTLKRLFLKADQTLLREDELRESGMLPVRNGTLEERVLRELCHTLMPERAPDPPPTGQDAGRTNPAETTNTNTAEATNAANATNTTKTGSTANRTATNPANTANTTNAATSAAGRASTVSGRPLREASLREQLDAIKAIAAARLGDAPAQTVPLRMPASGTAHAPATASSAPAASAASPAILPAPLPSAAAPATVPSPPATASLCATGQRQSPIDIRNGIVVDLEPITFEYLPSLFSILDTGDSVEARVTGNRLRLLGKTYTLERIRFSRPAEERLAGRVFVMGAHLEHIAEDGERLILAILLEKGEANALVQTLWNYLPLEREREVRPPTATIDPNTLLPAQRGYHTYLGSLTRPPCTEDVTWIVLKTPVSISPEQEAIFARLYPKNARPIQPTHGRRIKSSRD